MKMDSDELICCKICAHILNEPIRLPCENYICKAHENDLKEKQCFLCDQIHPTPENGWKIDKTVEHMVNRLKTIHSNIFQDEKYKELKKQIDIYEKELESYKVKVENPTKLIEDYTSNLISKVHLRREKLKKQIDEISETFINDIKKEKENLMKHPELNKLQKFDFVKEKEKVGKCNKDLNSYKLTSFKDWLNQINTSLDQLRKLEASLKENLLNQEYFNFVEPNGFEPNFHKDIFGKLRTFTNQTYGNASSFSMRQQQQQTNRQQYPNNPHIYQVFN
jgi:hypothetical protein